MDDREQIEGRLLLLHAKYKQQLPQRFAEIQVLWRSFKAGNQSALGELLDGLHRLAGSAASFGFPAITNEARRLEQLFESQRGDRASTLSVSEIEATMCKLESLLSESA